MLVEGKAGSVYCWIIKLSRSICRYWLRFRNTKGYQWIYVTFPFQEDIISCGSLDMETASVRRSSANAMALRPVASKATSRSCKIVT